MLCSRKDLAVEFEIIEGKQGEKSAKDALKLIKDGNREHVDRDTLLQWTWDDGEESDTRSFYGVNGVLGTEYQLPQEAKYLGLWNGKLYCFSYPPVLPRYNAYTQGCLLPVDLV